MSLASLTLNLKQNKKKPLFLKVAIFFFSFSKDNRRKPQKTSPLPAAAPHHNNLIDLDAIRQKRRMHLS